MSFVCMHQVNKIPFTHKNENRNTNPNSITTEKKSIKIKLSFVQSITNDSTIESIQLTQFLSLYFWLESIIDQDILYLRNLPLHSHI